MAIRWTVLAWAAVLAGLCCGLPAVHAANPAPQPRTEIVLDSSGAMLNPIDSYKKYYWIRKALVAQFATPQQVPAVAAGFIAYGFQKQQACDDVAVVSPIQPLDAGRFLAAVSSVRPRGLAPLAEALKQAAAALGPGGGRVLLIAGGADSCQQDPCATAKALVAAEPGLAIDVLSVGASDAELKQLQCIAASGNGTLFAATTLADSPKAFAQAFADLAVPPAVVAPAAVPPPSARAGGLALSAKLAPGGPATGLALNWQVRPLDNGKPGAPVFHAAAPTAVAQLPPGSYEVEAAIGLLDLRQQVEVVAGRPANLAVVLNAASLRLKTALAPVSAAPAVAPAKPDEPPQDVTFTIYRTPGDAGDDAPDQALTMLRDPVVEPLLLPAGTFRVVASRGMLREEHLLTLTAGQEQRLEIALASGKLAIEPDPGADPKAAPMYFVSEDDPDQPLGLRDVAQSAAPNPQFDLVPGHYHVLILQGAGTQRLDAVVKSGETTKLTVPLAIGRLRLDTAGLPPGGKLPDDLASFTVQKLDETGKALGPPTRGTGKEAALELEAGTYRVTGRLGLVNVAASTDVAVKPGLEAKAILTQRVAILDLRYGDEPAAAVDVLWEIRDAGQKTVWSTTVPAPVLALAPGTYWVHALRLGKDQAMSVALSAGERKTVAFRPE